MTKKLIFLPLFLMLFACDSPKNEAPQKKATETALRQESETKGSSTEVDSYNSNGTPNTSAEKKTVETTDTKADKWKKYSVKSGIVEYELTGIKGKEIVYWDNFGALEARYNTTIVEKDGQKVENEILLIYRDSLFYTINLKLKKGTKINMLNHMEGRKSMKMFDVEMLKRIGGKNVGKETILGKECVIWEMPDKVKVSLYNALPLKILFGEVKVLAKKLQENVSISPDIFVVPKGMDIRTPEEIEAGMKKGK